MPHAVARSTPRRGPEEPRGGGKKRPLRRGEGAGTGGRDDNWPPFGAVEGSSSVEETLIGTLVGSKARGGGSVGELRGKKVFAMRAKELSLATGIIHDETHRP